MLDLILVGTVHLDPQGRKGLSKIIEKFQPSILTVEISGFSVRYRLSNQEKWLIRLEYLKNKLSEEKRRHSRLKLLELQLQIPFEWAVAYEYGKANNIPCLPIDNSDLARNELPLWKSEVLSSKNLLKIIQEPDFDLDEHFKICHSKAKTALGKPNHFTKPGQQLSWLSNRSWEKREKTLAYRIKRVHENALPHRGSHLRKNLCHIHICGWMHLMTGGPWKTMADLLLRLDPVRILLRRMGAGSGNDYVII
ncbi:MAG: hypothetical protein AVO38_09105 [delta proteobacterium ML8_D]|nr:MAG: hypothetical protein AVO38_09105 [delta proteobacterium ML8_D]